MNGYIFSVMLVNGMMFSFLDLKYGVTVFESRYHLIPMLPSFFLLAGGACGWRKAQRGSGLQSSGFDCIDLYPLHAVRGCTMGVCEDCPGV